MKYEATISNWQLFYCDWWSQQLFGFGQCFSLQSTVLLGQEMRPPQPLNLLVLKVYDFLLKLRGRNQPFFLLLHVLFADSKWSNLFNTVTLPYHFVDHMK